MHKDGVGLGVGHQLGIDLIGSQELDAISPDGVGLAHGNPDIGVDDVGVGGAFLDVLGQTDGATVLSSDLLGLVNEPLLGEELLGRASGEVQAHLGAGNHQGVAHVVPGIAHVGEVDALEVAQLLLDGQQVSQHLRGMELIGQAVPNGHAGVVSQGLDGVLCEAAVLDAIIHPAQNAGSVSNGFLLAHLGAAGIQVGHAAAEVHASHFKRAAGTGGGLLEQQNNVLAGQVAMGLTGALLALELSAQVQQITDLGGGVVEQLQKITSSEIDRHGSFSF